MVGIGINPQVPVALPTSVPQLGQSGPALPGNGATASPQIPSDGIPDSVSYDAQVAEQKRANAVQVLSQQVADNYVLGDQTFTIYKDPTGQYITRYTSLRDGKVTYFPEPSLYKLDSGSSVTPSVTIKA